MWSYWQFKQLKLQLKQKSRTEEQNRRAEQKLENKHLVCWLQWLMKQG